MSNRMLAVLILVIFFSCIVWLYLYFFVFYTWSLTIKTNTNWYSVSLYSNNIKKALKYSCEKNICTFNDIPPLTYSLDVSKEWYKNFRETITVHRRENKSLNLFLEKEVVFKKVLEEKSSTWNIRNINISNKIQELKDNLEIKNSYLNFDLKELWNFYFIASLDKLTLYRKLWTVKTRLYDFEKISKDKIDILQIYGTKKEILISIWDDKYIYDLNYWKTTKFILVPKVSYVKKNNNIYSLVTKKGTFLYDNITAKIEYFYFFKDFVYFDDSSYIWVVYLDDKERLKNYNLESEWKNLIVKYDYKTKERKILQKTSIKIVKIIKEKTWIYIFDNEGNKYLIENI